MGKTETDENESCGGVATLDVDCVTCQVNHMGKRKTDTDEDEAVVCRRLTLTASHVKSSQS